MTEAKHEVIYKMGSFTITANITQQQLALLLVKPEIELISVNAPKKAYVPRKRKKK